MKYWNEELSQDQQQFILEYVIYCLSLYYKRINAVLCPVFFSSVFFLGTAFLQLLMCSY